MYKRLSTILMLCIFFLGTLHTRASLIGGYVRGSGVFLWNTEDKKTSLKNFGGNINLSWQTNRTEEFDFDFLVSASSVGLSGKYPMPSITWKRLMPLNYNVTVYGGAGLGLMMPKYQWKQRVLVPLITAGIVYYYTPKICIEIFGKRHFIFDDDRLNQSSNLNLRRAKGDVPLFGIRLGFYVF